MKKLSIVPLVLAASLTLAACGDEKTTASFETGTQNTTTQAAAAGSASASQAAAAGGDPSATSAAPVTPAEARTIEVNKTLTMNDGNGSVDITLHRINVHDYHVEAEVTFINNSAEQTGLWIGASRTSVKLVDDRGRTYAFMPHAGAAYESVNLQGGEGLDATFVFAGRLGEDVSSLKLDLSEIGAAWSQITFDVPAVAR